VSISEFSLIGRYFAKYQPARPTTQLGIGDDCALLRIPDGYELAVTTDTMVEGVHFFAGTDPAELGHKLLAVNLSDLASMGAEPVAVTLALTLPTADEQWLAGFSSGFMQLAQRYHVDLIGGDTTSGPLTLTVQAMGIVPQKKALLRSGARAGDLIYVTGQPGNAGLGLRIKQGYLCENPTEALQRFNQPEPRIQQGLQIRDFATACIDISDGVAQDLGHVLSLSNVGACLIWDNIPLANPVKQYIKETGDWLMPLTAGDDYELCFTIPPNDSMKVSSSCTCIGVIEQEQGLRINRDGQIQTLQAKGFEHFS
jgi:thiamine-monophosphate kinase